MLRKDKKNLEQAMVDMKKQHEMENLVKQTTDLMEKGNDSDSEKGMSGSRRPSGHGMGAELAEFDDDGFSPQTPSPMIDAQ